MEPKTKPRRRTVATIAAAISALLTLIVEALAVSEPIIRVIADQI